MSRSWLRQEVQVGPSLTYTDSLSSGSALESSSTNIEDDLNSVRSQLKRILDHTGGKWYDNVSTVNSKQRSLKTLNTDLDDMEEKRLLFRAQILTDITIAAAVASTGAMVGVAGTNLIDGETFTLSDGLNAATVFEFDDNASVLPGNIAVTFVSGDTASQVATTMRAAINGVGSTLGITATGAGANIILTNDVKGSMGNVTITTTVVDAGFIAGVSGMSGGAGDQHTLVVASSETPTETAAVDAGSANGVVVKVLGSGVIGQWSSAVVTGQNAINPKNLVILRDAGNDDPILSAGKEVFGLIQAQNGVIDGDAFDDTTKKVQLSFVRESVSGNHTLEHVPADDMGGKVINYMYVRRINLDAIPEQVFLTGVFVDQSAAVDVTLNNAIDNQSGPATQSQDIEWRIDDTKTLKFQDSTGAANIFLLSPNSGNDLAQFNVDTFDVNNVNSADFLNGAIFDSSGTPINVGVTAGQIDAAAKLTVATTGSNDLALKAGQALWMTDSYRAGSTSLTDGLKLAASSAEWSAFETQYGEVSLLAAITAASQKDAHQKLSGIVTTTVNAGTNVTGGTNLSATLQSYATITDFASDVNVFLNGQLLLGAAGATDDVYPGTTPATGDLKFTFKLKTNDVVTMETFANPM
jgi:hypothetical protein